MPDHKVNDDRSAGGLEVRREDPLQALSCRQQLECLNFTVSVLWDEIDRKLKVEDKLGVWEESTFRFKIESKTYE